jgi:hypothetical protein
MSLVIAECSTTLTWVGINDMDWNSSRVVHATSQRTEAIGANPDARPNRLARRTAKAKAKRELPTAYRKAVSAFV